MDTMAPVLNPYFLLYSRLPLIFSLFYLNFINFSQLLPLRHLFSYFLEYIDYSFPFYLNPFCLPLLISFVQLRRHNFIINPLIGVSGVWGFPQWAAYGTHPSLPTYVFRLIITTTASSSFKGKCCLRVSKPRIIRPIILSLRIWHTARERNIQVPCMFSLLVVSKAL